MFSVSVKAAIASSVEPIIPAPLNLGRVLSPGGTMGSALGLLPEAD